MKKLMIVLAGILVGGVAHADNLEGVDEMICAAAEVKICIENDTCYTASTAELGVPDFVIIDTDKKTVSTTKASGENRSTTFSRIEELAGVLYLQGVEGGRAFSFVIDVASGHMTVSVARDGLSVSVFGSCTDTDI